MTNLQSYFLYQIPPERVMMDKKIILIALFTMVITHMIYDMGLPFVSKDFHALFANAWFLTLFGFIALILIKDSIEDVLLIKRKFEFIVSFYFIYRFCLHSISLLQSFQLEGSWERYKIVTSNYYADGIVWFIILVMLFINFRKEISMKIKKQCQKAKII